MTRDDYRTLLVKKVEAETEKAYKLEISVSWNDNYYTRSFWFPKSVVRKPLQEGWAWSVKGWFADKMGEQHAFHGYPMRIDEGFAFTE